MAKEQEWSGQIRCLISLNTPFRGDSRRIAAPLKIGLAAVVRLFCQCSKSGVKTREYNMEVISVEEFGDLYGGTTDGISEDFEGLHVGRDDFGDPTYYGAFDRGLIRQGPHLVYHNTGGLAQSAHWVDGFIVGPLLQWPQTDKDLMTETDFGSTGAKTNTRTIKIFGKDELLEIFVMSGFECVATYLVKDKVVDLDYCLKTNDTGEVYLIEGEAIHQLSQAKRIR